MNKWVLTCILIGFCSLLFITGSFVGYMASEETAIENAPKKPKRMPKKISNWTVQIQSKGKPLKLTKARIPSSNAVMRARQY